MKDDPRAWTATPYLPTSPTLQSLRAAAGRCRGCPLYRTATQTVFGTGPSVAALMLVGEQPGDAEDLAGRPFVGPAGRLLDAALERAGVSRAEVYITNAVKHFKFVQRGKRRMHSKPNAWELAACTPWLRGELELVLPEVVVCLGATAAQALLGAAFRVNRDRGQPRRLPGGAWVLGTFHPAAILRQPTASGRAAQLAHFTADLGLACELAARAGASLPGTGV